MQYKRIVTWLESESALGEEDEQKAKALRLAAHLNLAMCYLKIQEAAQALENCDKVFMTRDSNVEHSGFGLSQIFRKLYIAFIVMGFTSICIKIAYLQTWLLTFGR